MSPSSRRAVALKYENGQAAPVIVASGMGHMAERIVDIAAESGVPVYEDNSLATMLAQLELGAEIPEALYKAIVEIYVYFLNFDPAQPDGKAKPPAARAAPAKAAPLQEDPKESLKQEEDAHAAEE